MLLDGGGVQLRSQDAQTDIDHTLQQCWQPFPFLGDVPLDCTLLGRVSRDFNVMTRRGQWTAQVVVHKDEISATASDAGLYMVLAGSWEDARGSRACGGPLRQRWGHGIRARHRHAWCRCCCGIWNLYEIGC